MHVDFPQNVGSWWDLKSLLQSLKFRDPNVILWLRALKVTCRQFCAGGFCLLLIFRTRYPKPGFFFAGENRNDNTLALL